MLVSSSKPLGNDVGQFGDESQVIQETDSSVEDSTNLNPVSWLGTLPPRTGHNFSISKQLAGHNHGTYRMWCKPPSPTAKVLVYRHLLDHGAVVVGVEFYGMPRDGKQPPSALLGFRTLWTEAAMISRKEGRLGGSLLRSAS